MDLLSKKEATQLPGIFPFLFYPHDRAAALAEHIELKFSVEVANLSFMLLYFEKKKKKKNQTCASEQKFTVFQLSCERLYPRTVAPGGGRNL